MCSFKAQRYELLGSVNPSHGLSPGLLQKKVYASLNICYYYVMDALVFSTSWEGVMA
jgi:hypothetical protein